MNMETANNLLEYRKKHRLSQEELAEKIGVSRQAVSKWERGEASPDTDNLIMLAQIYGVTLDELIKGNKSQPSADDENKTADTEEKAQQQEGEAVSDSSEKREDYVSFKNGIHIHSKDGDRVDIGLGGIHVHDKHGAKVDVDSNGVSVIDECGNEKVYTDENGRVHKCCDCDCDAHKKNFWYVFPFPIVVVIAFLIWGFCGGWSISWILFLTIPIYYSAVDAIVKKKPMHFAYPVLVAMVYVALGLIFGLWHPMWILFLTIPIYYCICDYFKK